MIVFLLSRIALYKYVMLCYVLFGWFGLNFDSNIFYRLISQEVVEGVEESSAY